MNDLSEYMRKHVYMFLDKIRGGHVRNHLADIANHVARSGFARKTAEERLEKLLRHSVESVPFYRDYGHISNLTEFPVIQKKTIKVHYHDFISTRFPLKSLIPVFTSGSYGTPFKFYLTRKKKARQIAEVLFFGRWAGYDLGMKHALVRISRKNRIALVAHNQVVMNPLRLDTSWLAKQRRMLMNEKIEIIIGFPSVIGPLASHCEAAGYTPEDFNLKGIITTGDPLSRAVRVQTEAVFGCHVLSRYASEELGVMAHECLSQRKHHVNTASYFVEILSLDSDTPAGPGEPGRVVVTDLFSHAMPLIRYDTGDVAVSGENCLCGLDLPVLESIEGRQIETIYATDGSRISPYAISCGMQNLEDVVQYQFIQLAETAYLLKMVVLPGFYREGEIFERMKAILGRDAEIQMAYVQTIPPLPSGKRPYIRNEMYRHKGTVK
jgi:phenylacetate-CoA ligase